MAASLESRAPFLDYRLVEFSQKLPPIFKVNELGNKAVLRAILNKYKKSYICENKVKQGYLSSEVQFINSNNSKILEVLKESSYWDSVKNMPDIKDIETKNVKYGYDNRLYRIVGFEILKKSKQMCLSNQ